MRVLVTSDDGVGAPGLVALARACPGAVVAAPQEDCGGCGTSTGRGLGWAREVGELVAGTPLWATPALIVRAACAGVLCERPDVVLCGVNHGPNVGAGVLHSGTVGAALTSANEGVPAVAISLDDVYSTGGHEDGHMHWETGAALARPLLRWVAAAVPGAVALSVNVPNREAAEVTGVRAATLETEAGLLADGYITVTALRALTSAEADVSADAVASLRSALVG